MISIQALAAVTLAVLLALFTVLIIGVFADEVERWKARRRSRVEADLDRQQQELRQTILRIAEELANERNEASREMLRAAFLADGQAPDSSP